MEYTNFERCNFLNSYNSTEDFQLRQLNFFGWLVLVLLFLLLKYSDKNFGDRHFQRKEKDNQGLGWFKVCNSGKCLLPESKVAPDRLVDAQV